MKRKYASPISRRSFLASSATLLAGAASASSLLTGPYLLKSRYRHDSFIRGVQIGVITYSYRSMPDQSAEATLQYVLDSGVRAVELMGDPAETFAGKAPSPVDRRTFYQLMGARREGSLTENQQKELSEMEAALAAYNKEVAAWRASVAMDKFRELRKMFEDAGVKIYAFKPNAFGKDNTDAEINYGMRAAKVLGASHVTLEHPSDDTHTLRLGNIARKQQVYVGYHGHEQQTPAFWDTALKQSPYNALNLDLGHYVAAGNPDPMQIIQAKHAHIKSMHVKDRQTAANGKGNLPWGTGDTPIAPILQLMKKKQYQFPATIELEYEIPQGSDAVKEVAKCFAYCTKALSV